MPRFSSLIAEAGVVIPVRSFTRGKSRLAASFGRDSLAHSLLGYRSHEEFVRGLADRAVDAAAARPTAIVSSAPEVVEWASNRGLSVVADSGSLDSAAAAGREWATQLGCVRVVVVHADLPDIVSLDSVAADAGAAVMVIVPCHRGDGTPVLSVPVAATFEFSYGPGSFDRHCAAAKRAGLDVHVVHDAAMSFDIDGPDDLAIMRARRSLAPDR
jgi:2-phospho-L-lactate/phosphoenolpyruvate guanylyltransferase